MADKTPDKKVNPTPPPKPDPGDMRFLLEQSSFWREFKDLLFPPKVPDLVLESKPIPVKDIWAPPKSMRSRMGSIGVHVAIVGIALLPFWRPVRAQIKKVVEVPIFVPPTTPPPPPPKMMHIAAGGSPSPTQAPKVVLPQVHILSAPTSLVPLSEVTSMPSFGSGMVVGGAPPGYGGSSGGGGGGTCTGANCGGGDGNGTAATMPEPIYQPDPDYSDAARKAKLSGVCVVQVTIGADGHVSHPVVVTSLGLGLDEEAIKAVLTWRFKPARDKDGKAVPFTANVEVTFRLY